HRARDGQRVEPHVVVGRESRIVLPRPLPECRQRPHGPLPPDRTCGGFVTSERVGEHPPQIARIGALTGAEQQQTPHVHRMISCCPQQEQRCGRCHGYPHRRSPPPAQDAPPAPPADGRVPVVVCQFYRTAEIVGTTFFTYPGPGRAPIRNG